MRQVLLELAMTSSGRTTSYDSRGQSGTPDYVPVDGRGRARLGLGDAPHLTFFKRWNHAGDDDARAAVLEAARAELEQIRRAPTRPPAVVESKKARDARITREGAGWPAREVAIAFRTGVGTVRNARKAAGLDLEYGLPLSNGRELSADERRAEILRLHGEGLSPHRIAVTLGLPRSSIRYVVARAPKPPTGPA